MSEDTVDFRPTEYLTARYHDWMSLKTNLLWIYEGEVPNVGGGIALFPEASVAWLLLKGEVEVSYKHQVLKATAGQWVIPRPGVRRQIFSPGAELLSVRFQAQWPDGRALFEEGLSFAFPGSKFPELEAIARELLEVATPHMPRNDPTVISTEDFTLDAFLNMKIGLLRFVRCLAEVLVECQVTPSRLGIRDERVLHALSILDFMPLSNKLLEYELAREVGLGLSQFVRLFRGNVGMTPKRYLDRRRRDACKNLLINSAIPLKQISIDLGFSHHSDFSHWFKKHYEVTPKEFRARYPDGTNI